MTKYFLHVKIDDQKETKIIIVHIGLITINWI